jgi:hypothetical protein
LCSLREPNAVAVDAGYKTPYISKLLLDNQIRPVMPYTRPRTKDGYFKKHDYVYDEYYDVYICPNHEFPTYELTNRDGYKMYRSNPEACRNCLFINQCTESKDHTKRIIRQRKPLEYLMDNFPKSKVDTTFVDGDGVSHFLLCLLL